MLKSKNPDIIRNETVEVLAPAGSFESLSAALRAGCDSVYFGVGSLNMRVRSRQGFLPDDLPKISRWCRKAGVRSCLTLNTVVCDEDLPLMKELAGRAADAGISAVIASDPAVIRYARETGLQVHISTQCNITNTESVRFYAQWADVVVLARELSLEQVAGIYEVVEREGIRGPSGERVRLEVFVHGALCMAVSGKCYLSLHSHNSSANQGACLQNCRRPYLVEDKISGNRLEIDNEYIMSAGDLCTIGFLDQILLAGARVLKIEGRGRSADYVQTTVRCYREAVEAVQQGNYTPEKVINWREKLASVYNRGFWEGYYLGRTLGEWSNVHGSRATRRKEFLGPCKKYYSNAKAGVFQMQSGELSLDEDILITGPTTGVIREKVKELRKDDQPVNRVEKGDLFSMPFSRKVRPSDKLYKLVPSDSRNS